MPAVIIAGDGARADVGPRADLGVAQITQVVGLGPFAQAGLFKFHEVAHMGVGFQHRAGPQSRKRPDQRALAYPRAFEMRKGTYLGAPADQAVAQHAMRGHKRPAPDFRPAAHFAGAGQFRARLHQGQRTHPDQIRRVQDDARGQQPFRRAGAQQFFQVGKLQGGIDAQQAVVPAALHAAHGIIFRHGQADQIRDVVFAALVVVAQARQQAFHRGQIQLVHARVDFAAFRAVAGRIVILGFHNADHPPLFAHHTPVCAGITRNNRCKSQVRAGRLSHKIAYQPFREQGRIAIDHQQMAAIGLGQRGQSLHQGMPRAELLALENQARIRKGRFDHFGPMPHHRPDFLAENRPQGFPHIGQHGLAQQCLQNLGPFRVHAGALAGRQNKSRVFGHKKLLAPPDGVYVKTSR